MMQDKHVEVAAHHTLSILRWRASRQPLTHLELLEALDTIYEEADVGHQLSATNGSYGAWKAITYDGVSLAYHHFFGQHPNIWDVRKYLREVGDSADWGIMDLERSGGLTDL